MGVWESKENIGLNKQYDGIAGTLIAFACRESFKRGHEVRTTHRPKGIMVLDGRGAGNLIKLFLE